MAPRARAWALLALVLLGAAAAPVDGLISRAAAAPRRALLARAAVGRRLLQDAHAHGAGAAAADGSAGGAPLEAFAAAAEAACPGLGAALAADFPTLAAALAAAGAEPSGVDLAELDAEAAEFMLLAPSEAAFAALLARLGLSAGELLAPERRATLAEILRLHLHFRHGEEAAAAGEHPDAEEHSDGAAHAAEEAAVAVAEGAGVTVSEAADGSFVVAGPRPELWPEAANRARGAAARLPPGCRLAGVVAIDAVLLPAPRSGFAAGFAAATAAAEEELHADCEADEGGDYNTGLAIASIFIVAAVSAAGAFLPLAARRAAPANPGWVTAALRLGSFFGFGTILATAFIHMLGPAVAALNSECLPESFNGGGGHAHGGSQGYASWPYLIAVLAILAMQALDYVIEGAYEAAVARREARAAAASAGGGKGGAAAAAAARGALGAGVHASRAALALAPPKGGAPPPCSDAAGGGSSGDEAEQHKRQRKQHAHEHAPPAAAASPRPGSEASLDEEEGGGGAPCAAHGPACESLLAGGCAAGEPGGDLDASALAGLYLLEAGVVFHSVIIGVALGVASGSEFVTLLVALCFHQGFEGFALGSAAVDAGVGHRKACAMAAVYAGTAPLGVAVGVAVRASYNASSDAALYTTGVFEAVAAGILIYVVLVELINPRMTQSAWLRGQRWPGQAAAFAALWAGAAAMAVVGIWA